MKDVRRGDIWVVNLDPTIGHEIKKSRPCVIIQNDFGNKYSPITIIAPITSQKIEVIRSFEVLLDNVKSLDKNSKVLLNQIRSVDKMRLINKLGKVDENVLLKVDEAIKISLGLLHF